MNKKNRILFNVHILFNNIPNNRLRENIFTSLKSNISLHDFLKLYYETNNNNQKGNYLLINNKNKTIF